MDGLVRRWIIYLIPLSPPYFLLEHNRSQKARDTCPYCPDDSNDGSSTSNSHNNRAAVISNSTHAYLALPLTVPLVPGHCLIVPVQHVVNILECEEAAWDEIRVSGRKGVVAAISLCTPSLIYSLFPILIFLFPLQELHEMYNTNASRYQ